MPLLARIVLMPHRLVTALRFVGPPVLHALCWLFRSREWTNFTYDLTPLNRRYLASFVARVAGVPESDAIRYLEEIENDAELRAHVAATIRTHRDAFGADLPVRFGRRIGWYALARAHKPKLVVETGVDKGLGCCVLAAALLRNADEGHPGRYLGTDINPRAGYLLSGRYASAGAVLYGDSILSLQELDGPIDLFVNDSDHSADYEAREYATVREKLADDAIVVGDNAHATDKLCRFAAETGRAFVFFREEPLAHWYPGGGIGAAFRAAERDVARTETQELEAATPTA